MVIRAVEASGTSKVLTISFGLIYQTKAQGLRLERHALYVTGLKGTGPRSHALRGSV